MYIKIITSFFSNILSIYLLLSKYNGAEFDSPELGKLAKDYIASLNSQEESIKYYY